MASRLSKSVITLMFAGGSVCGVGLAAVNIAATTSVASAATSCDNDHVVPGGGNLGDPGNGGNHHGEDNGQGNLGDPGNGANHQCTG